MVARKRPAAAEAGAGEPPAKRARRRGCYEQHKGSSIPEPRLRRPKVPAKALKVIAWNVAGLRTFLEKRSEELRRLVRSERPAVLGFIEHKLQSGPIVDSAVESLSKLLPDYHVDAACFSCSEQKKGYSGVALIWRKDLAVSKLVPVKLEPGSNEGRTLCLELKNTFLVLCYVPNSGDGLVRLKERIGKWDPTLRSYLQGLAKRKPVVLIGDLNVAHRDQDIWNLEAPHVPKSAATTPEERNGFGQLLEQGFVDGFAHFHPEAMGAFTYWSVRAQSRSPNRGLRLDYVVASKSLVAGGRGPRLLDAFHLPAYAPAGDHCPVGAVVDGAA